MNKKPEFGFILEYVNDMETAKRFYVEVIGLKVERDSPTFVQFGHFALASDEAMSASRAPEIYWVVDDAEAALNDFSRNAEISLPLRQMPFGKVFGLQDPTGQAIYFVEFARTRPSQSVK
jgi:predicted enzyme related to lactoylglutathione lyase